MAGRARLATSLVALAAGAGVAWFLWNGARSETRRLSDERARIAEQAARELLAELTQAVSVARTRAQSLSDTTAVRSAISTDATTVRDMVKQDQTLRIGPAEGVIFAKLVQGAPPVRLYAQPDDTAEIATAGTRLDWSPPRLLVWVSVPIEPMYKVEGLVGGLLSVRGQVDTTTPLARLRGVDGGARLFGYDLLGRGPAAGAANRVEVPLPAELGLPDARIEAAVAPVPPANPVSALLALAAGVGVAIAAAAWPRKRAPALSEPAAAGPGTDTRLLGPVDPRAPTQAGLPAFGRYRVVRKLATGGMADLYLCEVQGEAAFQKRIAVKRMHQHLAERPEVREWFLDEARVVAQLSHPNIIHVYELGRDETGSFFIAMELVEGLDLAMLEQRLREAEKPLPLKAALTIGLAICEGLHYAHTATASDGHPLAIVHRDMKPQNVLISLDGAVKVTDFGIAKASRQMHVTEVGTIAGTAAYMAPEQRIGEAVDARADLFAVGAIIYEMVTGQEIDLDLPRMVALGLAGWPHLEPPSRLQPNLPPALDDILFRALAFKAADRWPDCRELARQLERVLVEAGTAPSTSYLAEWLSSVGAGRELRPTTEPPLERKA
ncbi:MAG TPA: serine/threonine-protein kinase [Polyangia bacterium]|nr:serine/threonine-protein kinase [Polyangia bacterium]